MNRDRLRLYSFLSRRKKKTATRSELGLYSFLSRLPFPRSYVGKIMLVAFLGTHVPLLILIFYFVLSSSLDSGSVATILIVTLVATLLGTAFTLYLLYSLLLPISMTSQMLHSYVNDKRMPDLPTDFHDQAGRLMADVQYTVRHLDSVINSLQETSMTDYLTGAYNRFAAEKRLNEDIARVQRNRSTMSFVILDIDNFKLVNDRYGHDTGDTYLKELVNVINNNIRKGDWLARWGGDEFVLVLFHTEERSAVKILERIYDAIKEDALFSSKGNEINFTISAGVCQYNGYDDAKTLFSKSDRALYQGKRLGKGRIVCYEELNTPSV